MQLDGGEKLTGTNATRDTTEAPGDPSTHHNCLVNSMCSAGSWEAALSLPGGWTGFEIGCGGQAGGGKKEPDI